MTALQPLASSHLAKRLRTLAIAAFALALGFIFLSAAPGVAPKAHADAASPSVEWIEKASQVYCKVDGVTQKDGLKTIGSKTYLFDKKGRQLTGWHKVGKDYRFFTVAAKAKGAMVSGKVVNGVKLDKSGRATLTSETRAELKVLVKATDFVEQHTKATWSQQKKLRTCFNLLRDKYSERTFRSFSAKSGWNRSFALDIFTKKSGNCHSYAAAFAYIANAIGCKTCKVVSSGGHSWAEVNGNVYDPEWAKHCKVDLFAFPYSKSGWGGSPRYKSARKYVVTVAPRTKALGTGTSKAASNRFAGKRGLVKLDGARYFVKNGKAITRQWQTIKGAKYYFTGTAVVGEKFFAFSAKGRYDAAKTAQLRRAAKIDADATPLLALLGSPSKRIYTPSCYFIEGADGNLIGGQDGRLTYPHFTVYTFKADNGIEYYRGAEER